MKAIIETERLFLREIVPADAPFAFDLNSDPEVMRYTGDDPFASIDEAKAFLKAYPDYRLNGYGRWLVVNKEDNRLLGWCGLKKHPEYVDLGYRFFRKEWGKGYATEAGRGCLDYGFSVLNMDLIVGRVDKQNTGSIRVLEKLNMTYWKNDTCNGIPDALYYKLSKAAYFKQLK